MKVKIMIGNKVVTEINQLDDIINGKPLMKSDEKVEKKKEAEKHLIEDAIYENA